ncbi:MAG: hypothetical protein O3C59_06990 [Proteobacteria bacterium]|nr:hypothetical protein [Pseudomonadota bacterium]
MHIQANIYFTQSQVKCVPTDPELSSFCEQLALDDGALEFRLRLFAARIRGDASVVSVALAVPPDCVLRAQGGPSPFGDIPEDELHIFAPSDNAPAAAIAVERSVCDEVAAFAQSYGMQPAAIIVPGDETGPDITFPLTACQTDAVPSAQGASAPCAASSAIEMPPALQRELHKRKQQEARKAERANKSWALGGVFSPTQDAEHAPVPALQPFAPVPRFLQGAQSDTTQEKDVVVEAAPIAPASMPEAATQAEERTEIVAANDPSTPLWRKRPAVMIGGAACVALLLGTAAFLPLGQHAREVAPPVMPAQTAIAAAQPVVTPRANAPAQETARAPDATATPNATAVVLSSSTSLARSEAMNPTRPQPPNIDDRAPAPIGLPQLDSALGLGLAGGGLAATASDSIASRFAATFPSEPEITQIMPPRVPGRLLNNGRSIANLQAANSPSPAQALRPVTLLRPASALARIVPQPRPARPAPSPILAPALATPEPPRPSTLTPISLLGPASAPRPVARPVSLLVGSRDTDTVPELEAVATAPALAPDTLPQGPVAGLRVLAIVGTGDQRQALVQTGPNQTAVLVAGATTQRWQVLEVRREGIVLRVNGRAQLLPIGL